MLGSRQGSAPASALLHQLSAGTCQRRQGTEHPRPELRGMARPGLAWYGMGSGLSSEPRCRGLPRATAPRCMLLLRRVGAPHGGPVGDVGSTEATVSKHKARKQEDPVVQAMTIGRDKLAFGPHPVTLLANVRVPPPTPCLTPASHTRCPSGPALWSRGGQPCDCTTQYRHCSTRSQHTSKLHEGNV